MGGGEFGILLSMAQELERSLWAPWVVKQGGGHISFNYTQN